MTSLEFKWTVTIFSRGKEIEDLLDRYIYAWIIFDEMEKEQGAAWKWLSYDSNIYSLFMNATIGRDR